MGGLLSRSVDLFNQSRPLLQITSFNHSRIVLNKRLIVRHNLLRLSNKFKRCFFLRCSPSHHVTCHWPVLEKSNNVLSYMLSDDL